MAQSIALSHHERWDSTGYYGNIWGEEIPLVGRIVALVSQPLSWRIMRSAPHRVIGKTEDFSHHSLGLMSLVNSGVRLYT